jgi:hypothetical protein
VYLVVNPEVAESKPPVVFHCTDGIVVDAGNALFRPRLVPGTTMMS